MSETGELRPLPARPLDAHKGTFGTVLVVGGTVAGPVMLGAPCLAARAALRAGAGRVILGVPEPLVLPALGQLPEATGVPLPVDASGVARPADWAAAIDGAAPSPGLALVVGPGLAGAGAATADASPERDALEQVLVRLVARDESPLVLDAGALTVLSSAPGGWDELRAPAIITPHPGEFRRIAAAVGVRVEPTPRESSASELAGRLGAVVVLKGASTVVSDGIRTWTNGTGGPALAAGGTGDVLAGLIGGLAAAYHRPAPIAAMRNPADLDLFELACLGVLTHGRAADAWSARHGGGPVAAGLLAGELADRLPAALATCRTPSSV